jgi:hypothetical protein
MNNQSNTENGRKGTTTQRLKPPSPTKRLRDEETERLRNEGD